MRRVGRIADSLQRKIGFDRSAEVELATVKQLPTAVFTLSRAQITGNALFEIAVDGVEIVLQQDVFGRDRRVGLELEQPVAVTMLARDQPAGRPLYRGVERARRQVFVDRHHFRRHR